MGPSAAEVIFGDEHEQSGCRVEQSRCRGRARTVEANTAAVYALRNWGGQTKADGVVAADAQYRNVLAGARIRITISHFRLVYPLGSTAQVIAAEDDKSMPGWCPSRWHIHRSQMKRNRLATSCIFVTQPCCLP